MTKKQIAVKVLKFALETIAQLGCTLVVPTTNRGDIYVGDLQAFRLRDGIPTIKLGKRGAK